MVANKKRAESGAALIEFAFVLIPTLGFTFLLIALAWVVFAWACVQEGVREGARVAITCAPTNGNGLTVTVQQAVQQNSYGFINSTTPATVQYLDSGTLLPISSTTKVLTGDVVKVTIQDLPVTTFAPIMRSAGPLHVTASAADVMSCPTPTAQ